MSNRYVTEAEKAGTKRRMDAYLARLAKAGIKRHQLLLTDVEVAQIKKIVACWRSEPSSLDQEKKDACTILKP